MALVLKKPTANPYAAVIADLERKRAEIDKLIESLRAFGGVSAAVENSVATPTPTEQEDARGGSGEFAAMTMADAAKVVLARRGKAMTNADILAALRAGGLPMTSKDPLNTLGAILNRRAQRSKDLVRAGRGKWTLPKVKAGPPPLVLELNLDEKDKGVL